MNELLLEQLAQEELDGTLTEERSAQLKSMLSGSEEARTRYEEIRSVVRILDAQGSLDPPASLKANVLASLGARRPESAKRGWRSKVATALHLGRPLGAFTAFAAGALVALIVAVAGPRLWQGGADRPVSGTIGAARGTLLDRQTFELAGGSVECATWRSGERVTVRVLLRAKEDADVRLEFDPARVTLLMMRPPQGDVRCTSASGRVEFQGRGDAEGELELRAGRDVSPMTVTVRGAEDSSEKRGVLKLH